ncbi:MAG TPA: membrane protein insertase YidC [Patescibacteria group bacterium]|nr:membrane protein insertase YidC [Patescibacteria group bacterium]
MDKRSLLAIVATFLVLILWQVFYIAPKQKEMARKRAVQSRERVAADSSTALELQARDEERAIKPEPLPVEEAEPSVVTETFNAAGDEPEEIRITVTTDKMGVVLNSRGGEIESVKLLEFEGIDGGPVELVPQGGTGGFSLVLQEGDRRESLSGIVFETTMSGERVTQSREVRVGDGDEDISVVFKRAGPGGSGVEKRFTFGRGAYEVWLTVTIVREGELQKTDSYAIQWDCGMAVTENDVKGDQRQFASMGRLGEESYKESLGKFRKIDEKGHEGMVVWAGARTKYFLSAIIPERQRSGVLTLQGNSESGFIGYTIRYPFRGDPRIVEDSYACYLGPLDMETLKAYGVGLEKTIDLGKLRFLSVLILNFMTFLKRFIPNYGLIIIILSVLTKVLFYRLTHKSFKSMKDMQSLQPRIKELQAKYKDDKTKMNEKMMQLYKEAGVNPLGGCLPLLLQMPVFIALFNVLRNTIEIRNAPFFLWMDDLASPDTLFRFGVSLPFIGNEFHLLPILMGAAMVLQSKMGASPTGEAAPQAQTKMMSTAMPIIFTVFFYGMPSGLVLYWFVNNILTIIQQYYVHKEAENEEVASIQDGPEGAKNENGSGEREARDGEAKKMRSVKKSKPGGGGARGSKSKRRSYH